ncbi:hypothetical protein V8C37DRAFT_376047 [Trichoderma ceciliae]
MDPSSGPPRPPAAGAEHQHEHQHELELELEHQPVALQTAPKPALKPAAVDSAVVARDDAEDQLVPAPDPASDSDAAPVATHLARFEFSDHGTKILMVEWYPGVAAATTAPTLSGQDTDPSVDVDSDDKAGSGVAVGVDAGVDAGPGPPDDALTAPIRSSSSPVADAAVWEVSWTGKSTFLPARDTDENDARRRRVYFMLPPDAPVPATVTIARPGRPSLVLKPLPAIFPEHFQAESGPRGVLHTIWAKKRLRELELEMEAEMRANAESVGLEMALAERQWIVDNFLRAPPSPAPITPRSPVSGRLGDKLKGLRLATSPADLVPSPAANTFTSPDSHSHMLSPIGGDIAVSSFSAISRSRPTGPMSLDAALKGDAASSSQPDLQDTEDDLFALPMSPRSPDMIRSPFSALGVGL